MAFLLILFALLGFVFAGFGSGSSSSGSGTATAPAPVPTKCAKHAGAEANPSHCRPPTNP